MRDALAKEVTIRYKEDKTSSDTKKKTKKVTFQGKCKGGY